MADPLPGLSVHLRKEVDGPVLHEEAVVGRDLAEAMAEIAFEAGMRRAGTSLALSDVVAGVRPLYRADGKSADVCRGFELEIDCIDGHSTRREFGRKILEPVAVRASRRLVDDGRLAKGDLFYYSIAIADTKVGPLVIDGESSPPTIDALPLAPLWARSKVVSADRRQSLADETYALDQTAQFSDSSGTRAISLPDEEPSESSSEEGGSASSHYPVFYTTTALTKAERVSRKGASHSPPVESGGLLLGRLYWCPDEKRLFGIVDDVLEATQSQGTTYSLTFTDGTWARVQAVLRARQRNPMTRGERILGQCHGHNFLPHNEGATCDGCPVQGDCPLTTAYLSTSDRIWCRAVFPREPWQLSHVFGLTPRREAVSGLFGQSGGELVRREYRVLEDGFGDP